MIFDKSNAIFIDGVPVSSTGLATGQSFIYNGTNIIPGNFAGTNDLTSYLPLSAGSNKTLTGNLYTGTNEIYVPKIEYVKQNGTTNSRVTLNGSNLKLDVYDIPSAGDYLTGVHVHNGEGGEGVVVDLLGEVNVNGSPVASETLVGNYGTNYLAVTAGTNYLTVAAGTNYLTVAAGTNYLTDFVAQQTYLTIDDAALTYQPQGAYLEYTGGTMTGAFSATNNIILKEVFSSSGTAGTYYDTSNWQYGLNNFFLAKTLIQLGIYSDKPGNSGTAKLEISAEQIVPYVPINAGTNKFTSSFTPTNANDIVNKAYADGNSNTNFLSINGGTANGYISAGTNNLYGASGTFSNTLNATTIVSTTLSNSGVLDVGGTGSTVVSTAITPKMYVTSSNDGISSVQFRNTSAGVNASMRFMAVGNTDDYMAFDHPGSGNNGTFWGLAKSGISAIFTAGTANRDLVIGTVGNGNMKFGTNNTIKGVVTNAGNWGFGVTTPTTTVTATVSNGMAFSNSATGIVTGSWRLIATSTGATSQMSLDRFNGTAWVSIQTFG